MLNFEIYNTTLCTFDLFRSIDAVFQIHWRIHKETVFSRTVVTLKIPVLT